jgi:hypothetical protein
MSVNNENVIRYIRSALAYGRTRIDTRDSRPARVQQIDWAFDHLYQVRNSSARTARDIDLTAAEHYMCARYLVASGTYPRVQVRQMSNVYFQLKLAVEAFGGPVVGPYLERLLRNNPNIPTSPTDLDVFAWANLGADHGERDRVHARVPEADFQFPREAYEFSDSYRRL